MRPRSPLRASSALASSPRWSHVSLTTHVEWKTCRVGSVTRDVALSCLGFALLRAWASVGRPPLRDTDSSSYMHVNLLGHGVERLWTVPALFTALPSDSARTLAQLVIGIACWSALALAVAHSLDHPLVARVGALSVLLLGLCVQVTEWDQFLLSESLALSLTALLVASLLWVRLRPTRWAFGAMLVVLTLWVFTRQLQAALFALIAVAPIAWILLRRRRLAAVAAALALVAVWAGYATTSSRALVRQNAHNLLVLRILQSPEGAAYFDRRGMPQMKALRREAAMRTDQGLQDPVYTSRAWRRWIDAHWERAYAGWVIRHPIEDIRAPLADAPYELSGFADYASVRPALPRPIQDTLWERGVPAGDVPTLVVLTLVLWLAALRAAPPGSLDALGGALLVVTTVWYFVGWHLAAAQLPRIFVPVAMSLRVSLLILALAAVDRLIAARVGRASRAAPRDDRVCERR
jgi:hypothetical protein